MHSRLNMLVVVCGIVGFCRLSTAAVDGLELDVAAIPMVSRVLCACEGAGSRLTTRGSSLVG